ncbi:MAG TPA: AAA family ATPase [Acidimicrobiales bacterium]|nr:AAA family ATPase [Acidimicrobiales bacterium]
MSRPGAPDAPPADEPFASTVETHTGVVVCLGDRAYKVKKPVRFPFCDFSTRERRRAAVEREVALNRRLAPDVYLGVADVLGPDGDPCDHLVVMRRLPAARRLADLVLAGAPVDDGLRSVGRVLARFHAGARRSAAIDAEADAGRLRSRWEANAAGMASLVGPVLDPAVADRVLALARRYLDGRGPLLAGRIAAGRVCDGHGDLLADDVYLLDDGPRILDCLEFDDRLRSVDGLADVASLAMDLERLGRPDLGARFLADYRAAAGDDWPASLAHHYVAYRAQVRALVAGLRVAQGDAASAGPARALLEMAAAHLEAARVRLVVVGGLPGTGKSTLARALARALDAVVVRSDVVRKELAGLDPGVPAPAPAGRGLYDEASTAATYAELLARAEQALAGGHSVVVDATFADDAWRRAAADLGRRRAADLDLVHCVAPTALSDARLTARAAAGADPSDATPGVARALAATEHPWSGAVEVDTSGPLGATVRRVLSRLGA